MFPAIHRMLGIIHAQAARQESMPAVLTMERNNADQRGDKLARRLRTRTKHAVLPALWAGNPATHSALIFIIMWNPQSSQDRTIKAFPLQSS
jgi:hypothetical protein